MSEALVNMGYVISEYMPSAAVNDNQEKCFVG